MQSWIRNKRKRRGAEFSEDELTSCVFGPLRYMEPSQAWKACRVLCGLSDGAQESGPQPTDVCVLFWPWFPRTHGDGHHVEPDAQVVAWNGDALLGTILIETKWGSPLGPNQLLDQWRFITAGDKSGADVRRCSTHVLLGTQSLRDAAATKKQQRAARKEDIDWGDRLITLSWFQVAAQLLGLRDLHGSIETWRQDVIAFLACHGVAPFNGFPCDRLEPVDLVRWQFEAQIAPGLVNVGSLNWSFEGGGAV